METALSYGLGNDYEYLHIDRFAKLREGRYTVKIVIKSRKQKPPLKLNFFD